MALIKFPDLFDFLREYRYLRDHFREKHFLCEEDECARTEFTNAFRSEIDIKAHVSTTHSKHLGRHQARQLRTIDIDINYGPRSQDGGRRNTHRHRGVLIFSYFVKFKMPHKFL